MEYDDFSFVNPYITSGEHILWRGKPGEGNLITSQDIFLIPFSIFWCGFAIFWTVMASQAGVFALFGIPFVCVGLYLVFGRFLWTSYIRKRTLYVITDRKIVRKRGNRIDMQDLSNAPIHVTVHKNGYGTIRIGGTDHYYYNRRSYNSLDHSGSAFLLENVPDVARVQQILYNRNQTV